MSARGLVLLGAGAAVLGVVIAQGWVSDDAFITFRVIDNFVHGHGLRWNVDERVEVYTHPLWMGLLVPFHALWGNLFFTSIAVSVVCTGVALLLAVRAFPASLVATLGVLLLPLALSRAATQFATSGLENALSYLLFGLFAWHAVRPAQLSVRGKVRFPRGGKGTGRPDTAVSVAASWAGLLGLSVSLRRLSAGPHLSDTLGV